MTNFEKWKAGLTPALMYNMWQVSASLIKYGASCANCPASDLCETGKMGSMSCEGIFNEWANREAV